MADDKKITQNAERERYDTIYDIKADDSIYTKGAT